MKRRILGGLIALATLVIAPRVNSETPPDARDRKEVSAVELTIDYADGMQKRFPSIPWVEHMTVMDALKWADKHPRGIQFSVRGKGATAIVTRIDDLKNTGGKGKNWVYRVNGKLGDRSCGVFLVKPGHRILWKFERYK